MEMKNGFNFQGANFTASGGSYRRTNEVLEYGQQFWKRWYIFGS